MYVSIEEQADMSAMMRFFVFVFSFFCAKNPGNHNDNIIDYLEIYIITMKRVNNDTA